jgi:hypothetical protein
MMFWRWLYRTSRHDLTERHCLGQMDHQAPTVQKYNFKRRQSSK